MDWKLELVTIPVSNVDRAKAFYVERAGFILDHDHLVREGLRFVQLTPPGSSCSIAIGTGLTESAPGSAPGAAGQSQGRPTTNRGLAAHSVIRRPARPACSLKPLVPERAPTLTAYPDTDRAPSPQSHVPTTHADHTAHSAAGHRSAVSTTSRGRTVRPEALLFTVVLYALS
jgi:catechol 2,3-dioxygenase-like lactoylglutathione lyase family enzyme